MSDRVTTAVAILHVPAQPLDVLSDTLDELRAEAEACVLAAGGAIELLSDQLVVASFPSRVQGIDAALTLARVGAGNDDGPSKNCAHTTPKVMVALGTGRCVRRGGFLRGNELSRAFQLAGLALPGQVLCTAAVVETLDPPAGVGIFRAPAAQELAAGYPVHVIADYR